ncbi:hypothetical protein CYMTET_31020 [Cymbomonas tetramitiformis]|uniref:Ubiquinone biosynthesis O-methyltransferase, mitochondrial n=1 Tax=Cymbomonas tetramitiformis TaxID=36881 RepID=A0AAE0FHV2_9CHLO|nr:hypothetical protein CYMTET_31020 [Cymbomonas tetramitiformis]
MRAAITAKSKGHTARVIHHRPSGRSTPPTSYLAEHGNSKALCHHQNHRKAAPGFPQVTPAAEQEAESGQRVETELPRTSIGGRTVDSRETDKFGADAAYWWNMTTGPFAPLHGMNPIRCSFIRNVVCSHYGLDSQVLKPFAGLKVLDVGCGGGILCEPMARLGAEVLGVDAAVQSIDVAKKHAALDSSISESITYRATTAEQLVEEGEIFDVVLSLEVIEHVKDVEAFTTCLSNLTKPGGALILSTMNRTPLSYSMAIIAAEHVLRWVPQGTHDWTKFITPQEMIMLLRDAHLDVQQVSGLVYNPLMSSWSLSQNTTVNYIAYASKPDEAEHSV